MTPALLEAIQAHAHAQAPRECCGVLVWDGHHGANYHPCRNIAEDADDFEIHSEDWVAAEDAGTVLGIVHSHPGGTLDLSGSDQRGLERSGVPWWVVDIYGGWKRFTPPIWTALGHPFAWGIQDCFTLARDYYPGLPDFLRGPGFWALHDLFSEGLASAGFVAVAGDPALDDALLLSINGLVDGVKVPNHCAVYLGAGRIAHHLPGRLSREEDLGPLNRAVVATVRRV